MQPFAFAVQTTGCSLRLSNIASGVGFSSTALAGHVGCCLGCCCRHKADPARVESRPKSPRIRPNSPQFGSIPDIKWSTSPLFGRLCGSIEQIGAGSDRVSPNSAGIAATLADSTLGLLFFIRPGSLRLHQNRGFLNVTKRRRQDEHLGRLRLGRSREVPKSRPL